MRYIIESKHTLIGLGIWTVACLRLANAWSVIGHDYLEKIKGYLFAGPHGGEVGDKDADTVGNIRIINASHNNE